VRIACIVHPRPDRARREALDVLRHELRGHHVRLGPDPEADLLVAVGGDGTVNRALPHLGGGARPLGILPTGTANDLAGALRIPRRPREACDVIRSGCAVAVDLLGVNGVPFATSGALGIAAAVSARVNRWRRIHGVGACVYSLAAIAEILHGAPPLRIRVEHDGGSISGRVAGLLACNQSRLGGTLTAAPDADPSDGHLDLALIPACGRGALLTAALRMRRGRPRFRVVRVREAILEVDRETTFYGDGEPLARGRRFRIEARPAALRVLAPER
jgi:diacylglycerol kinase (ATP)